MIAYLLRALMGVLMMQTREIYVQHLNELRRYTMIRILGHYGLSTILILKLKKSHL